MYPEISTALVLRGLGFDPNELTASLGLTPTRSWLAGQRTAEQRPSPTVSGWMIQIGPARQLAFADQINELLTLLEPKATQLRTVAARFDLSVEISCVAYVEDITPALHFTIAQLAVIQSLGADVDVDYIRINNSVNAAK